MDKVSKAITVYVPGYGCNLQCDYCYQRNAFPVDKPAPMKLKYPLETMIKAFSPERIGGLAEFTVIGSAETLLAKEIVPFVHGLLHYGHVVTIVTNATLSQRINELLDCPELDLRNLIVKASFHFEELMKRFLLSTYFDNIKAVLKKGASAYPFVVISPAYLNYLKEISELMQFNLGIKAHCSPCNKIKNEHDLIYSSDFDPVPTEKLMTELDKYFDTRIYRECVRYKDINVQTTFCYAGSWSLGVDLSTGSVLKCHNYPIYGKSFFENIDQPYEWDEPVAMSCGIESCCLQYNFFSEGLLPDFPGRYSLGQLIYQPGMISEYLRDKLDVRFDKEYQRLSQSEENRLVLKNKNQQISRLRKEADYYKSILNNLQVLQK